MKGYFIMIGYSSKEDKTGIGMKIRNQISAFNKAGMNCGEIVLPVSKSRFLSVQYRLPFFNVYPIWTYRSEFDDADYIYLRRPFVMNRHMRKVFARIKARNPKCKIIVEIPTYPYDAEYGTYKAKEMLIWKDRYNRNRMQGLVDRFADLTGQKEIFGIPTLKIINGIDVDKIRKKTYVPSSDGTIHMCAVAAFKEWHGYERLIEGVKQYYQNGGEKKIKLHFVGDGSELPRYRRLVREYGLDAYFEFHGYLRGSELDRVYDISDISLGTFGMYKINLNYSCNLKSREAVARGIPMVTGCPTDIFTEGKYKYYFEFPNDPSVVDIRKIIDFVDEIYKNGAESVIEEIRQYAYENVTMDAAMKNVIDYCKS